MTRRDKSTRPKGRSASDDPANRFDRISIDLDEGPTGVVATEYFEDSTKSVISRNASPDVGFESSLNPYLHFHPSSTALSSRYLPGNRTSVPDRLSQIAYISARYAYNSRQVFSNDLRSIGRRR
jgi:hypothetical protein